MPPEIALQVRNLTKRFGPTLAVDDLSLDVFRGEILGFLGPNGAGKTTSIHIMVGLLDPTSGDVLIEGQSIRARGTNVRNPLGVCPQENIIWDKLTCLEQLEFVGVNYGLGAQKARGHGKELLDTLGLAPKANELAGRLSGGMKRRLNLALALVYDPHIVFLDEPEAGLDPQSRVLVRETIRGLARRKTVVLTTHNMDEADRLADRIAIVDHGRLLVLDTPDALKRRCGQGTVLEMELAGDDHATPIPALLRALKPFGEPLFANGRLTFHGDDLPRRLPAILQEVQASGRHIAGMAMRAATLEDVFLSLTGRGLRE